MDSRIDITTINGAIAGYDPGGNDSNGFAWLDVREGKPVGISVKTLPGSEAVINEILLKEGVIGLGVDTLSCWSTGTSGWRPADWWLRKRYPKVRNSIMSPNTLSGSMGINGMSVLIEVGRKLPGIRLSETHPKVLYYALAGQKYDYEGRTDEMDEFLSNQLGLSLTTSNDHEWDAALSAYALFMGITGAWKHDLHTLDTLDHGRMIEPCGKTFYYWPDGPRSITANLDVGCQAKVSDYQGP